MGNRFPGGDGGADGGPNQGGGGVGGGVGLLRRPSDVRDFFRRRKRSNPPPSHHLQDPSQHPIPSTSSSASTSAYHYNRDKINSCPDLVRPDPRPLTRSKVEGGGGDEEEERSMVGLKIYRSYSDIPDSKMSSCSEIPTIEVRVYRRSTKGLAASAGKAVSLPRGMERSLGATSVMSYGSDFRPSPRDCTSAIETRSSRRGSSRCSMASIGYRVSPEEFPDTATVKRKLKDFESNFVSGLVDAFQCLPPLNQLAAISIATRPDRVNQTVSLLQYIESDTIPADLQTVTDSAGLNREYVLTISDRSFEMIRRIKLERLTDQRLSAALDILRELAREAAQDLERIFEYQLALIMEPVAMRLLARHAVDCIVHVLKRRSRILDRNTVVQGVLRGRPRIPENQPRFISIIVGSKELKWNIYEVFKRPALRKEMFAPLNGTGGLGTSRVPPDELDLFGGRLPWKFYTSAQCEPMTYGYRGQLVEWDYVNCHFRLNSEEETAMAEEVSWRYDDFHRLYTPYQRLIGHDAIESYFKTPPPRVMSSPTDPSTTSSLADFVRLTRSGSYVRDEIQLVFRPLGPVSGAWNLRQLGLDELDVARVRILDPAQERSSLKDTAIEVTRRCDELRCRLEEMESLATSPMSPELDRSFRDDRRSPNPVHNDTNISRREEQRREEPRREEPRREEPRREEPRREEQRREEPRREGERREEQRREEHCFARENAVHNNSAFNVVERNNETVTDV